MTTQEQLETEETEVVEEIVYEYKIDAARMEQLNRSLNISLLSHRCPNCKAKIAEAGVVPPADKQIKEMVKCCVKREDFIKPEMPLQEIVFRTILAAGNKPVRLEVLHDAVTERWYSPINPRNIDAEKLKAILDNDVYYGFMVTEKPANTS